MEKNTPWQKCRTPCVGSAVLASQPLSPQVMCVWPGSGPLTVVANPEPATKGHIRQMSFNNSKSAFPKYDANTQRVCKTFHATQLLC